MRTGKKVVKMQVDFAWMPSECAGKIPLRGCLESGISWKTERGCLKSGQESPTQMSSLIFGIQERTCWRWMQMFVELVSGRWDEMLKLETRDDRVLPARTCKMGGIRTSAGAKLSGLWCPFL